MTAIKFKKEDVVLVISGKSKGSQGKIIKVLKDKYSVLVEGLNRVKKHEKPNPNNEQGGIVEKEMPIHISNVMLVSSKSNKPVRLGTKVLEDGKRIRIDKKSGDAVD